MFFSPRTKIVALIDIASGSIGSGVLTLTAGKKPFLVTAPRIPIRSGGDRTIHLVRALDSLAVLLTVHAPLRRQSFGSGALTHAYVSLGAPWQKTEIVTKVLEEQKPFLVSPALLRTVLGEQPMPKVRFESALIRSTVNGYQVESPLGKMVRRAEFLLLRTHMDEELHDRVTSSIKRIAPSASVVFEVRAFEETLKRLAPKQSDYVGIRVTEEDTTIVLVKGHKAQSVLNVPLGTASFTRAALQGGVHLPTHDSLIDVARNASLEEALQKAEQTWIASVVNQIKTVPSVEALPETVFLVTTHEARHFMKRLLEKPPLLPLWLSGASPKIIPILPSHFSKTLSFEPSVHTDVQIAMLALSASTTTPQHL